MTSPTAGRRPLVPLLVLCALGATLPATALALTKPKPGLWEHRSDTRINGRDLMDSIAAVREKMMAGLPPERRAMMQKQSGGDPHVTQSCLTAAQVAKVNSPQDFVDQLNTDRTDCKYTGTDAGNNSFRFHGSCAGSASFTGDIDGLMTIKSPTAYTVSFTGKGTGSAAGATMPVTLEGKTDARWLAADCGDVKVDE